MQQRLGWFVTPLTNPFPSLPWVGGFRLCRRVCWFLAAELLAGACALPSITIPAGTTTTTGVVRTAADFRRIEAEVFADLNSARANPQAYSANLAQLLPLFSGNLVRRPGWPSAVQTNEGASAVREAISALSTQSSVPILVLSDALSQAARDLASDQSRTGDIGHTGSDGSTPESRMTRYGTWGVSYSENADYGGAINGRDVIEDMIIDDGVQSRGHRRNTFDATARVVGVGCAPHPRYGVVCVIDAAGAFTSR
jgi:uncharacterized protein YkwD